MKKSERMEEFIDSLGGGESSGFDPCYLGYFECFNTQRYYKAHDVLEHLWLQTGKDSSDYAFYKGLIQLAGGFVHLKLQYEHPQHPKHGRRLAPARRLFLRAIDHLAPYQVHHGLCFQGVELRDVLSLGQSMAAQIEENQFEINPWNPKNPPILPLPRLIPLPEAH